jgi:RNA polymerase sigma-70 factor (ECF subfamily)
MDEADLIARLRDGDARAMTDFVTHYRPALERVASGAISPALRNRISPDSVAQSVCRTFLDRMDADPFVVRDESRLWSLLCAIALTKVRERVRFHRRHKRSVEREIPIEAAPEPADRGAAPDEAVALRDAFEHLLSELGDEERRILLLKVEGRTQTAIAEEVGCSERTVRRLLHALEQRFRERLGA